jgi:Reverse transcriptase (RNA-dependent DNA polymerase)
MMITIDISNAFNSASWHAILTTLNDRFHVPAPLIAVLHSYLTDREMTFEGNHDEKTDTRIPTARVPQRSVLGPSLWNVLYTTILDLPLPRDVYLVAYADDTAILVQGKSIEKMEERGAETLRRIERHLRELGPRLVANKTEALLFTRKRALPKPTLKIEDFEIPFKRSLKYLGVHLDDKLRFTTYIQKAVTSRRPSLLPTSALLYSGPLHNAIRRADLDGIP